MSSKKYTSNEHKILLVARKLAQAGGGTVSRTHLRLQVSGLTAADVDDVLRKHNIHPSTLSTANRGRPVTVYSLAEIERACNASRIEELPQDNHIVTGYARALMNTDTTRWLQLSSRILNGAHELAKPSGSVTRSMLKRDRKSVV